MSRRYGREVGKALNTTLVWVHSARPGPANRPLEAEQAKLSLRHLREEIIRDCETLARVLRGEKGDRAATLISEANVRAAQGILFYQLDRLDEAQKLLRDALAKDPLMEEAWETLAQAIERKGEVACLMLWKLAILF